MRFFGLHPINSPGTDAMQKTNRTMELLKPLMLFIEVEMVRQLLAPIWRVVAAVDLFFPPGDHAGSHGEVRATVGDYLS
jgi:hypothetical protein